MAEKDDLTPLISLASLVARDLDFALCNCTETLSFISSKNCLTLNYCLLKSKLLKSNT